jgi:hypothetical protein
MLSRVPWHGEEVDVIHKPGDYVDFMSKLLVETQTNLSLSFEPELWGLE